MATTIAESVSRIRNQVKGVKEDAFLTDRFLYSLIAKYAKLLIKRQDNENKIMRFESLWEVIPCLELIEVDKVEACCTGIKTNCTIRRTKDKIPAALEGAFGPLLRSIMSLDRSIEVLRTYPAIYTSITNLTTFKYNKNKYYWYIDRHLYFPDLDWDGVLVEGIWEDNIDNLQCDTTDCQLRQENTINIPEYLFAEVEAMAVKDLTLFIQLPVETQDDKQSQLRS